MKRDFWFVFWTVTLLLLLMVIVTVVTVYIEMKGEAISVIREAEQITREAGQ